MVPILMMSAKSATLEGFGRQIPTFIEVTRGKLVGGPFWPSPSRIGLRDLKVFKMYRKCFIAIWCTLDD